MIHPNFGPSAPPLTCANVNRQAKTGSENRLLATVFGETNSMAGNLLRRIRSAENGNQKRFSGGGFPAPPLTCGFVPAEGVKLGLDATSHLTVVDS